MSAAADECSRELDRRVALCAGIEAARPGRDPSDFGFWLTCDERYRPDYERCLARQQAAAQRTAPASPPLSCPDGFKPEGSTICLAYGLSPGFCENHRGRYVPVAGAPARCEIPAHLAKAGPAVVPLDRPGKQNDAEFLLLKPPEKPPVMKGEEPPPAPDPGCQWAEAQQNIDWVLSRDAGARRTFDAALSRAGAGSCYDAVLIAQRHNPRAQASIRTCAGQSQRYIQAHAACTGGRSARNPADPRADTPAQCARVEDRSRGVLGWYEVTNRCEGPVTIVACFTWSNGTARKVTQTVTGTRAPISTPGSVYSTPRPAEAPANEEPRRGFCVVPGGVACSLRCPM